MSNEIAVRSTFNTKVRSRFVRAGSCAAALVFAAAGCTKESAQTYSSQTVTEAAPEVDTVPPTTAPPVTEVPSLVMKRGSTGPEVAELQGLLMAVGCRIGNGAPNGLFGPRTETAVSEFENNKGMSGDGVVDEATLNALNEAVKAKDTYCGSNTPPPAPPPTAVKPAAMPGCKGGPAGPFTPGKQCDGKDIPPGCPGSLQQGPPNGCDPTIPPGCPGSSQQGPRNPINDC